MTSGVIEQGVIGSGLVSSGLIGSYSSGSALDPMAASVISRMSTPPSAARAASINKLAKAMRSAGVTDRLDAFQVYAAADSQAALLDWLRPASVPTVGGATPPTHVANKHFYSNTTTGLLDTKFNPSTAVKFTNTDNSHGCWNGNGAVASRVNGVYGTTGSISWVYQSIANQTPSYSAGQVDTAVRSSGTLGSTSRTYGLLGSVRDASPNAKMYAQGVLAATVSGALAAYVPNGNYYLFAARLTDGAGSTASANTNKISAFFAGASLSAAQMLAFSNALEVYMQEVGNWVQPVVCWGDSLTFNTTEPNTYPNQWREKLALGAATPVMTNTYRRVVNEGSFGEDAADIAIRMLADTTYNDYIQIIWAGRNGFMDTSATLAAIASMVAAAQARSNKYLVLSVPNANYEAFPSDPALKGVQGSAGLPNWEDYSLLAGPYQNILTVNNTLASLYGAHYVDVWTPMVATGTAGEQARVVTPLTCLNSTDPVHLNATGMGIVFDTVQAAGVSLGYF